ncbi:MAG: bifunctional phosphoribosyl-AMP cyclohydrolase/phosphoribosyl-ATP diphosphatase HisIE [Salinivirgaceae bacterium]
MNNQQLDTSIINFDKQTGLVPAVVQDADTMQVLMLGYMNLSAVEKTLASRLVTFFSRSRQQIWVKGETSGNFLQLKEIKLDCDADTLLVTAIPKGNVCHTGSYNCFGEEREKTCNFLPTLQKVIDERKRLMPENSYTTTLFAKGIDKIAQKVGEEAVETVIEAKNSNDERLLNESADLLYHLMVLLSARELSITDVEKVLEDRHAQ